MAENEVMEYQGSVPSYAGNFDKTEIQYQYRYLRAYLEKYFLTKQEKQIVNN